ncbi:MAG TPA: hypothetical protein VF812_08695 [Ktedonobacterales bacterium]
MGIALPGAGEHVREWRESQHATLDDWAARLAPRFREYLAPGVEPSSTSQDIEELPAWLVVDRMKWLLWRLEDADSWDAPHPEESIFVFLSLLRECLCQNELDQHHLYAIALAGDAAIRLLGDDPL